MDNVFGNNRYPVDDFIRDTWISTKIRKLLPSKVTVGKVTLSVLFGGLVAGGFGAVSYFFVPLKGMKRYLSAGGSALIGLGSLGLGGGGVYLITKSIDAYHKYKARQEKDQYSDPIAQPLKKHDEQEKERRDLANLKRSRKAFNKYASKSDVVL